MNTLRASALGFVVMLFSFATAGVASAASAHVYLIRGLFNVSVGLDAIGARLAQRGIAASIYDDEAVGAVAAEAARAYAVGVHSIVLVGHSLGGGAAVSAARQLGASGVPVALMILLDPVGAAGVPSNVRRVINLYVGVGGGLAVGAEAGFRGNLNNLDLSNDPAHPDHMTIQSSPAMQDRIIAYIRSAASEGGAARVHHAHAEHTQRRHRRWKVQSRAVRAVPPQTSSDLETTANCADWA
jgi:pimeloyl-ACP methyl ester carboxylesterase